LTNIVYNNDCFIILLHWKIIVTVYYTLWEKKNDCLAKKIRSYYYLYSKKWLHTFDWSCDRGWGSMMILEWTLQVASLLNPRPAVKTWDTVRFRTWQDPTLPPCITASWGKKKSDSPSSTSHSIFIFLLCIFAYEMTSIYNKYFYLKIM